MKFSAAVIDTNVVVAGLLTGNADAPTSRIVDGMRRGAFPFLLSPALLAEYREVLLRKKLSVLHGLSQREVDVLLTEIVTHAIVREPVLRAGSPDPDDAHVWSLALSQAKSALVTGDSDLANHPAKNPMVVSPREFVEAYLT